MPLLPSRRTAALTGAALAAAALPLTSVATSASAADEDPATTTYSGSLNYLCDITAGVDTDESPAIRIPDFPVPVAISFDSPRLEPFTAVGPIDIRAALNLESARFAQSVLGFTAASGESTNATLSLDDAQKNRMTYRIPKLSAPRADVPETGDWIVNATGQSPVLRISDTKRYTVNGPDHFDVDATLYTPDTTIPSQLSCDVVGSRKIVTVPVGDSVPPATPSIKAAVEPSTTVKANSTGASVHVVTTSTVTPTGDVDVFVENGKRIRTKALNTKGNVRIPLPRFGQRGQRVLKVVYRGDDDNTSVQTTARFTVR